MNVWHIGAIFQNYSVVGNIHMEYIVLSSGFYTK